MIVSEQGGFVFVHIQKTAGTALVEALKSAFPDARPLCGKHDVAIAGRDATGEATWSGYFKFAFVRNPWDRLVSWYAMIDAYRSRLKGARRLADHLRGKALPKSWRYVAANSKTFEEFIVRCTDDIEDYSGVKSFVRNQVDYVTDERGDSLVDFVGRYENFESDLAIIRQRLGRPLTLNAKNASKHDHYSRYYTRETRDIVAARFARDIAAFDYRFEAK